VTSGQDRTARVWDVKTLAQTIVLQGHSDAVYYAAFSPDGKRVVTASYDRTARVWNAETGKPLTKLSGHDGAVRAASFSLDGKRVLTASADKTARIWDSDTGELIAVLKGHRASVENARYSPDGLRILTASADGTARIWPLFPTTQALIDYTKSIVPRCLTPQQRQAAYLSAEPPAWCIEMKKWPYQTAQWRQWLADKAAGKTVPLPSDTGIAGR